MSLRRNIPLGISGRAGVLGSVYAWTAHGQYIKLFYAHLASPGTRPQRNPGKAPGNLLPRCRKMRQHRQRYFHAGHRRPSPAVKWHHAARARIRFPQPGARQGRHAAKTRGQGQRRWQEAVPAEGHRPRGRARCAAPQYAGGGTGSRRPRVGCGGTRRNRPGSGSRHSASCCGSRCAAVLAAIASATVRGPVASARDDPRRPAARSARPQHRQLPSRTPCMTCRRSRPEPRKDAERRAGIRNLRPIRIPALPGSPIARDPASRGAGRFVLCNEVAADQDSGLYGALHTLRSRAG